MTVFGNIENQHHELSINDSLCFGLPFMLKIHLKYMTTMYYLFIIIIFVVFLESFALRQQCYQNSPSTNRFSV